MKNMRTPKTLIALVLLLSLTLALAACGSSTSTTIVEKAPVAAGDTETTVNDSSMADVSGEISEIIGNEITLRLFAENEELITEESRTPGSGAGRGATGETVPREYSGETLTLVIPVGTPIFTRVRTTSETTEAGTGTGPVEQEIGLDDLKVGTQMKIYYVEGSDKIEKILAIPPRS